MKTLDLTSSFSVVSNASPDKVIDNLLFNIDPNYAEADFSLRLPAKKYYGRVRFGKFFLTRPFSRGGKHFPFRIRLKGSIGQTGEGVTIVRCEATGYEIRLVFFSLWTLTWGAAISGRLANDAWTDAGLFFLFFCFGLWNVLMTLKKFNMAKQEFVDLVKSAEYL